MNPLSRSKLKFFKGLLLKKNRESEGLFLAEGRKMVEEGLKEGWSCEALICRNDLADSLLPETLPSGYPECWLAATRDMDELSSHETPEGIVAVFRTRPAGGFAFSSPALLLESVRDPGNLGTIIRTADWFGIRRIIASQDCVDCYNPKVLRATMGSFFRTSVEYTSDFHTFVQSVASQTAVADMQGRDPSVLRDWKPGYLLLGNESHGVSPDVRNLKEATFIAIPGKGNAESLNVSVACGILLYLWQN